MNQISIWVFLVCSFLFLFPNSDAVDDSVKSSLIQFLAKLSSQNGQQNQNNLGWNMSSDPCRDKWLGLVCDGRNVSVKKLFLDGLNLSGTLQTSFLCNSKPLMDSLTILSINQNNISGEIPAGIENCKQLTRFHVKGNKFQGNLPSSFSKLVNLKRLELSDNNLSGNLPDLSRISGLTMFLAENNKFSGEIPEFEFSNFERFNASFNNFSGPIPTDAGSYFASNSFMGNPLLCGDPLPRKCHSLKLEESKPGAEEAKESNHDNKDRILMYIGYIIVGVFLTLIAIFMICKRRKRESKGDSSSNRVAAVDEEGMSNKFSTVSMSSEYKTSKPHFSMISNESGGVSSSLIVLTSSVMKGMKFEDLLKAPAELIGRGNHGSLYKVMFDYGMVFAVKRIKDWGISTDEFMERMGKIDRVKHLNVLPPLAFYSSDHEKLLVYEFQPNGSLFSLLHGSSSHPNVKSFPWISRLETAAKIGKALAQMHKALQQDEIPHGNLKSSNILLNWNMEPCISEYGLMESTCFKSDVFGFGLILLELLTGKLERDEKGVCLADWVRTVLTEEWTAEVLDTSLMAEAASEERMVNLLVVAVKCVERSPNSRPNMDQVVAMIDSIMEEMYEEEISSITSVM